VVDKGTHKRIAHKVIALEGKIEKHNEAIATILKRSGSL
jgi:hypothetical protein